MPRISLIAFIVSSCSNPEQTRPMNSMLVPRWMIPVLVLVSGLFVRSAPGQVVLSPAAAATNHTPTLAHPPMASPATNSFANSKLLEERSEQIRSECIAGRRHICGRVLQIVPDGLVVDSGYTNLLRPELSRS